MSFFSAIGGFFKKIANAVLGFFKGKNPVDAINDTTKTIIGAATAGLTVFGTVKMIRNHLIPSKKAKKAEAPRPAQSGAEYIMQNRENGTVEDKIASMKANTSNINARGSKATAMKQEELNMLAAIAETRNAYFKELGPEEQMSLLVMEGFDFEAFKAEHKSVQTKSPLKLIKEESKVAPTQPFREEKDYGFFNFIMRPLSNFYHWAINDPIPKKCEQIKLIDLSRIPDIPCETTQDAVDAARALNSYLESNKHSGVMYNGKSQESAIEQQILIDEAFRHDTLDEYTRAVNRRLKASMANPSLYAMLTDEREGRRLDDDRDARRRRERDRDRDDDEGRNRRRRNDIFADEDDDDGDDYDGDKKRTPEQREADRYAEDLIRYHMDQARRGIVDHQGYGHRIR